MNGLRFLVIFILLTVGISGEDSREGRGGWSTNHRKPNNFRRRQNVKKPMSFGGHNNKFNGKIRVVKLSPPVPSETESALQNLETPQQVISPPSWKDNVPVLVTNHGSNGNIADGPPPSFGSSPTIIISDDGEVSFGRSINFNKLKSFHDEYFEHNHDHDHITEEDSDHSSKSLRTVRSAPNRIPGRPEQLGATLGGMQQGNLEGLQTISTSQGAQAWNNGDVYGSGGEIVLASSGESNVEGAGTMTAAGVVSVTSSGESSTGWRSPSGESQTYQGVNTGNGAHAGDYLDATVSGLTASVSNSGSSSTTGSGTVYTSGTTTNVVNQGGWRAGSGTGTGTFPGANVGSSGGSSVTGSGTVTLSGNTNVVSSGGGGSGSGWKP